MEFMHSTAFHADLHLGWRAPGDTWYIQIPSIQDEIPIGPAASLQIRIHSDEIGIDWPTAIKGLNGVEHVVWTFKCDYAIRLCTSLESAKQRTGKEFPNSFHCVRHPFEASPAFLTEAALESDNIGPVKVENGFLPKIAE